jgi:isochorismate pyruvate lyase
MKTPQECRSLDEVRLQIDEIDNGIIGLIGERFTFVKEIVKYKNNKYDIYAPDRYNEVINRRRELAVSFNLDPDVIENMYRIMMDYFIKEELELLKNKE